LTVRRRAVFRAPVGAVSTYADNYTLIIHAVKYVYCQRSIDYNAILGHMAAKRTRRPGHPPTGLRGEKVSEYKRLTVRLPSEVRLGLKAASGALRRPEWRVLVDALLAYWGGGPTLSDGERRVVRAVLKLHEK
jgi:hypothetical protein